MPTPSSPFTSSTASHCYERLPSLEHFAAYIRHSICPENDVECSMRADHLQQADYLDVDYDAISRSLVLTTFHRHPPGSERWDEDMQPHDSSAKTEVGILTPEKAADQEELSLEGFLAVVVPPASGSTFLTTFLKPSGLHPTLRITFPSSSMDPPEPACALHSYLTLPSSLFVDKYQLSSPNLLASNNLHAIRALSGETDLEAPDWRIKQWGSLVLLELALAPPVQRRLKTPWHADVPLHLRYLSPTARGESQVDVPWPVVFWACPAEEGTKMSANPFDRVHVGYDSLFGPRTMFYHFQPRPAINGGVLVEQLTVPVLELGGTRWVESGTMGVVCLGAAWVVWKLTRIFSRDRRADPGRFAKEKKT
ncbi:MAG: hypothetical protein LQ345_002495 [Seirophora villosa]|nr:MAG: hypothetical protein LQ345_002495 [Seirophora villosa]